MRLEYFDSDEYEATCIGKRTISLRECSNISPTTGTKTHPYVFQFTSHMGEGQAHYIALHGERKERLV